MDNQVFFQRHKLVIEMKLTNMKDYNKYYHNRCYKRIIITDIKKYYRKSYYKSIIITDIKKVLS